jgi:hypothetical protein
MRQITPSWQVSVFKCSHCRGAQTTLLQEINEERLTTIAHKVGAPFLKEVGDALYGGADFTVLKRLPEFFTKYLHTWQLSNPHHRDSCEHFVIRHGLCRQWSIFSAESIKKYAKDLGLDAKYDLTDNTIMITIRHQREEASTR